MEKTCQSGDHDATSAEAGRVYGELHIVCSDRTVRLTTEIVSLVDGMTCHSRSSRLLSPNNSTGTELWLPRHGPQLLHHEDHSCIFTGQ